MKMQTESHASNKSEDSPGFLRHRFRGQRESPLDAWNRIDRSRASSVVGMWQIQQVVESGRIARLCFMPLAGARNEADRVSILAKSMRFQGNSNHVGQRLSSSNLGFDCDGWAAWLEANPVQAQPKAAVFDGTLPLDVG